MNKSEELRRLADINLPDKVRSGLYMAARHIDELQSRLESVEKDAARYKLQKMFPVLRVGEFHGKFRAECGSMILSDWLDSYDEAFDTAIQANKA